MAHSSMVVKVCITIFALTCAVNCSSISFVETHQTDIVKTSPLSPKTANKDLIEESLTITLYPTNLLPPSLLSETYKERLKTQQTFNKKTLVNVSNVAVEAAGIFRSSGIVNSEAKITGGSQAVIHEFPWQAFVQTAFSTGFISSCGGTLISENWILTAAQCVVPEKGENVTSVIVLLGAYDRAVNDTHQKNYQGFRIRYLTNWNPYTFDKDVALIELTTSVIYSNYIRPILLARWDEPTHVNDMVTLSGWGKTSDSSNAMSSILQKVLVPVISNSDCAKVYGYSFVTSGTICSSGSGDKGACNGDEGSPMIYQLQDGSWIQIGIFSFVLSGGCQKGYPNGFTRVSYYIRWIESVVGEVLSPTTTSTKASTTTKSTTPKTTTKTTTTKATTTETTAKTTTTKPTTTKTTTKTRPTKKPCGRSSQMSAHLLLSVVAIGFILIAH